MTLEELAQKLGEFMAEEIIKPLAPKPLTETREERMGREYSPVVGDYDFETEMELLGMHFIDLSKIRGGPGNPTVNAFEPTYCNHAEIAVKGATK